MRSSRLLRAALALAIALAASGAFVVAPVSASTNAPTPSWWNGDCDANHWNLAAAAQGWTGPGAHRLGASYLGIPVCGPRRSVDGAPDVQWSKPGWGHFEWECTELAFRFMYLVYGVTPYGANGNTVVANYKPSYGGGLVTVTNGTVGTAPQPGDVMSFDSPSGFGHAAVVTSSQLNAQGTGTVTLMSQNDTTDGWRTLSVNAWKVQPFGSYVPSAWLHDPAGRGGTGVAAPTTGSPSSSTSGPKSTVFLRNSLTTGVADASFPFGPPGAQVLSCDWDGDGVDTPAWFLNGTWGITNKNVAGADVWMVSFGQAGDVPLCGDWNGTGKDTIGVWRDGVFLLRNINTGGPPNAMFAFGSATDRPVVGDWTGQGKDTVGVYRKGAYLLRNSNSAGPADAVFGYGDPGDQPLVGDWNGDGKDTIGIWRNGALYLKNTNATGVADYVFGYGNPGDAPIIGDWNGQGKDTLGVVRG
jgi:hypothetical protein